jgi:hypothetical protein
MTSQTKEVVESVSGTKLAQWKLRIKEYREYQEPRRLLLKRRDLIRKSIITVATERQVTYSELVM